MTDEQLQALSEAQGAAVGQRFEWVCPGNRRDRQRGTSHRHLIGAERWQTFRSEWTMSHGRMVADGEGGVLFEHLRGGDVYLGIDLPS